MRIADKYLKELIANEGELTSGPISDLGVLRLALDLREARERIIELECGLKLAPPSAPPVTPRPSRKAKPKPKRWAEVVEENVSTGSKVDYRA